VLGTPAYMAPEQVAGEPTPASDQYAFCVTAWEACFGQRPFAGKTIGELHTRARLGQIERPDGASVPREVEAALRRGLAFDAAARFPTMDALLAALTPAPPRPRRRRAAAILAGAAALAVAGGLAVAPALRRDEPAAGAACDREGSAITRTWNPDIAARVAAHGPAESIAAADRWTAAWQAARATVCRAVERGELSDAIYANRIACYEQARATFDNQVRSAVRDPHGAKILGRVLPDFSPCDAAAPPFSPMPGPVDVRSCGCPYSGCTEAGTCVSVCRATAFRYDGPVANVSVVGRQEALLGVSLDGDTLLYLAGDTPENLRVSNPWRNCRLAHLFVAHRRGDAYEPVELTAQLDRGTVAIREGCCTLAPDGRSILVLAADRRGFVRLMLDGDRLTPAPADEFAAVRAALDPDRTLLFPVLTADQRTLYYRGTGHPDPDTVDQVYVATRAADGAAFEPGRPSPIRDNSYITGFSSDGLTQLIAQSYSTRVQIRETTTAAFYDLGIASPLPAWRSAMTGDCGRIYGSSSPGGCEAEDIVLLTATRP
jgi:hypothetical protein